MKALTKSTPIILVGFMGAGKSTIGRLIADRLGRQYIDTDILIENRFRKSVADIFAQEGEAVFRKRESTIIREVCYFHNVVISTGGGLPCHDDNMHLLNECGITIYMQHSAEELAERLELCKWTRPSAKHLSGDTLLGFVREKLNERQAIYEQAQMIINYNSLCPDNDEKKLADSIIDRLQQPEKGEI